MMRRILVGVGIGFLTLCTSAVSPAVSGDKPADSARPKITGIDHVRLYVSDVPKSLAFYTEKFGLATESRDWSGKSSARLGVNSQQYIELKIVPSPAPQNWVAEVAFATNDAEGLRRYLAARGITAISVSSESAAPHFEVRDPEGNQISFIQRAARAEDYKVSPRQVSNRMLHAGFVVKDMATENKFYRDLLGFRTYWYGGFKDNDIDWYEIQVPDGGDWIEFMLNIPANADHKELGVQNHFSLGVKDAGVAAAQLRKQGLRKFDGPEVGRDGKNSLDAYDLDGTRVEVMEFTPRQTPCCHAYEAAHPNPR